MDPTPKPQSIWLIIDDPPPVEFVPRVDGDQEREDYP